MREKLENFGRYLSQMLRLMVGVPDYNTHVRHMQETYPGQTVMMYEDFFRERQDVCYAGRVGRYR